MQGYLLMGGIFLVADFFYAFEIAFLTLQAKDRFGMSE
jgi:hypothetical protein